MAVRLRIARASVRSTRNDAVRILRQRLGLPGGIPRYTRRRCVAA